MASNGVDPVTGAKKFPEEDAPQLGADLEEVSEQAVYLGTRPIGTTTQMNNYDFARAKLRWGNTTDGLEYEYNGSSWAPVPGLIGESSLSGLSTVWPTDLTEIADLKVTGAPIGVPCVLVVAVTAENANSGGARFFDLRAYNGPTASDVLQRFSLPFPSAAGHRFSGTFNLRVTPSDDEFTLRMGCDQASSVVLRNASLMLFVRP